jgi:hypothetical protein
MEENIVVKKIAFLINGEVFYVLHIPQVPEFQGVYEGIVSGPTMIDVSENDLFIEPGTRYMDGEFYVPVSKFVANTSAEPDYELDDD